jgi:hypothetical protein
MPIMVEGIIPDWCDLITTETGEVLGKSACAAKASAWEKVTLNNGNDNRAEAMMHFFILYSPAHISG